MVQIVIAALAKGMAVANLTLEESLTLLNARNQKRMAAIVKNGNGVDVITNFVTLQVNGNNSATKKKMNNHCHRFNCARLPVGCLSQVSSHPGQN